MPDSTRRPIILLPALAVMLASAAPAAAVAAEPVEDTGIVASMRSFPKTDTATRVPLAESVSTSNDADWGGIEPLDVPKTKSAAEIRAEREARERAEREKTAAAAARTAIQSVPTPAGSATGESLAAYASRFVGSPYLAGGSTPAGWDCSGFVHWVFAQYGVSLPHRSGSQALAGSPVAGLADARPGDIVANGSHAAIYIGNGLVVNALNPMQGTQITGLGVFTGGYAIRRIV